MKVCVNTHVWRQHSFTTKQLAVSVGGMPYLNDEACQRNRHCKELFINDVIFFGGRGRPKGDIYYLGQLRIHFLIKSMFAEDFMQSI